MKIKKHQTDIPGCFVLEINSFKDNRGEFTKLFHSDAFRELGLEDNFKEEYFSISSKGVLRGLHFQEPPHDHIKCISCISGSIFDVVVDLRTDSPTYKNHLTFELDSRNPQIVYIPSGLAHGFYVYEDNTIFLNKTNTVFNSECDTGIKWDSCGISWPNPTPILSEKDKNLVDLKNYKSPF